MKEDIPALVNRLLAGDKAALARLITLVENESPRVPSIMQLVSGHLRKPYRLGITGLAGSGKSTLIDKLLGLLRQQGLTVGVIAIDPSSALTGGAVLGDRIRMKLHYPDEGVFIRSMATRGISGGLCQAVDKTIDLLDAFGYDVIIIETTGVGQTETEITRVADTVIYVLPPGFGDSVQLMKAGLIEIADIIVINKADLLGAEVLAADIKDELSYSPRRAAQSIVLTQAHKNIGIDELFREIEKRGKLPGPRAQA
jgi:LAO/AO transport system kinase